MKNQGKHAAILTLCGILSAANALENPEISLPLMPKAPQIDGKINADEWKYAACMSGSCWNTSGTMGKLYPAEMNFWVGADREKLYIAVRRAVGPEGLLSRVMPDPEGNPDTHRDDSIETVIIPDLNAKEHWIIHSNINNRGAIYKMKKSHSKMSPFQGKWETKGSVSGGLWDFESAISWKELGLMQVPRATGVRICCNWQRVNGFVQTAWEPVKTEFFGSNAVPVIHWHKDAPVVQVGEIRNYDGIRAADGNMTVFNPSGREIPIRIRYHFFPANSHDFRMDRTCVVSGGETKKITLPGGPLNWNETAAWSLSITSPDGKDKYYTREVIMAPGESKNVFRTGRGDESRIAFHFAHYPSYRKMLFQANLGTLTKPGSAGPLKAVLRHGNSVIAEIPFGKPSETGECLVEYGTPDLEAMIPSGKDFTGFQVDFFAGGKKISTQEFEYHKFPWKGNLLGKSDTVVPPFTGVSEKDGTVSVLLRDYTLNSIGLPAQITAKGENILDDGGFSLCAKSGSTIFPAQGVLKIKSRGKTFLETESDWTAGPLTGKAEGHWDQDGMLKFTLTLNPGDADALSLKIPLMDAKTPLMHTCGDGARINYAGTVPEGMGKIWDSTKIVRIAVRDFVPYLWLGSDEIGLAVFGDNDKGWIRTKGIPEFELFRENGKLFLRLNLISRKTVLREKRKIVLGFMATPVKPMPADFRRWNAWAHFSGGVNAGMMKAGYFTYSVNFLGNGLYFGTYDGCADIYPCRQDIEILRKMAEARKTKIRPTEFLLDWLKKNTPDDKERAIRKAHLLNGFVRAMGAGQENLFYFNARGCRFKGTPEGRHYLNEWYKNGAADREIMDAVAYDLDPRASYRDYAVWWYKKILETGAMDQMYWDDLFLTPNTNLIGTDAYLREDGTVQPSTGIFELRELIRRSAVMMAETGRTPKFMLHMTSTNLAPVLSFGALNFDWEEDLGTIDFQDRHPQEYIRAMSHGRQTGNFPVMLVATSKKTEELFTREQYRHWIRTAAGVMLTHELRWHKEYPEFWNTLKRLYDLGYASDQGKVFNYWEKDCPVKIDGGRTSSLAWSSQGKAGIMVCDWGEGGEFRMTFDRKRMGLPDTPSTAADAESGKKLVIRGNEVHFSLKKHDFIIIELKGQEAQHEST